MIPYREVNSLEVVQAAEPSKSYQINPERMCNIVEEREAMKQAVYLILNTERYQNLIYSWNYGMEQSDLIGMDQTRLYPELQRRIQEALLQDDRIYKVDSFGFSRVKNRVTAEFTIHTRYGEIPYGMEVNV